MNDHKGAALILPLLPPAKDLIADRGYNSNRFRTALIKRGIAPCIPSTRRRKVEIPYDKTLYRQRHRIENTLGRLKDWRRIATRYDRCAHTFFSAICIAATVTFWLG
jgi:transposase